MNFNDVLKQRRSIRKYKNDDVSKEQLLEIISYGVLAPSAKNRQPWRVKIATFEEKNKISDLLSLKKDKDSSVIFTADVIRESNKLLVIFQNTINNNYYKNDLLSLGAFIENMTLKATEMGLGSLWIANTDYINDEIKDLFKTEFNCVSVLAVGYKNQDVNPRPRNDIEDIII